MSSIMNVLNLEMMEQGGGPSSLVGLVQSSQSSGPNSTVVGGGGSVIVGTSSSQSTIGYVQDLVNEVMSNVSISVATATINSGSSGQNVQSINNSSSSGEESPNNSNSSPKRPLEKDGSSSLRSKRSKKNQIQCSINLLTNASKLEQRLGGILCCAVCLDLPKSSVYQVCLFANVCFL